MANKKDFATSTVLTAPSPDPTTGTSLVVQSGHGARFPSAPFYVTVHPHNEFPTLDNAEKLLVSAKSTDTFTITRAQGDTTAKAIEDGWRISNAVFLNDIPDTFDNLADGTTNKAFTSTEKTKLAGIATGATSNSSDATLLARANHTGTQTTSTISDFNTAADARVAAGITGKVDGSASSTDNAIARFDSTTGKIVQNSGVTISDSSLGQVNINSTDAINIEPAGGVYINTSSSDGIIITASATGYASGINISAADGGVNITNDNLKTNTISERTSASGVTIDGVLIKDGLVDGVDVSTLGSGTVNSGAAGKLAYYASTGTAVSAIGELNYNGSGKLSIGTGGGITSGQLELYGNSGGSATIQADTAASGTYTHTLPAATTTLVGTDTTQTLTNKTLSTGSTIDANVTVTEVLKKVYPVGSVYIATVSTNPGTLLGFGTWSAFAAGRTIIGVGTSDQAFTAGSTGGESAHTLSLAEMPAHSHTTTLPANSTAGGNANLWAGNNSGTSSPATNTQGSGAAHNNLPPYVVAYIWQRTA